MSEPNPESRNRREFLTGKAMRDQVERAGDEFADGLAESNRKPEPIAGDTVHLSTTAMACDFSVILNRDPGTWMATASDALELVHQYEAQMSIYRPNSELSLLNERAAEEPVEIEEHLFELLARAGEICRETDGTFDPTSGPVIELWRQCRQDHRVPSNAEMVQTLEKVGIGNVELNSQKQTVEFTHSDVRLNLGGIGKGYALDRAAELMIDAGLDDFLIHGGHSSILARGNHENLEGWPVGVRNPLFPTERLATVLLQNCALSSSGDGTQHFRIAGRRYGHILDPRSGWPVEGMLSVTVLAPTAAEADALSTAFFVGGVEIARGYCDNHPTVSALLIPPPRRGRTLEPVNCGVPDEILFFASA